MGDYEISFTEVAIASGAWAEQADQLRGAAASIDEVDATAVGPRASGALALFCDHWSDRLRSMQEEAQGNADALRAVMGFGIITDEEQAQGITGLLPHGA